MGLHDTQLERAAIEIGRAAGFEERHARQVARLALMLFDQTEALHGLGARDRLVLHAAGLLHDIGITVSFAKHHKHSMKMIREAALPALSPREREMAALVARYHRKRAPTPAHEPFAALQKGERQAVCRLAALLRVADVLDREHQDLVRGIRASMQGDVVALMFDAAPGYLPGRDVWAKKAALFETVFNRRITVRRTE